VLVLDEVLPLRADAKHSVLDVVGMELITQIGVGDVCDRAIATLHLARKKGASPRTRPVACVEVACEEQSAKGQKHCKD